MDPPPPAWATQRTPMPADPSPAVTGESALAKTLDPRALHPEAWQPPMTTAMLVVEVASLKRRVAAAQQKAATAEAEAQCARAAAAVQGAAAQTELAALRAAEAGATGRSQQRVQADADQLRKARAEAAGLAEQLAVATHTGDVCAARLEEAATTRRQAEEAGGAAVSAAWSSRHKNLMVTLADERRELALCRQALEAAELAKAAMVVATAEAETEAAAAAADSQDGGGLAVALATELRWVVAEGAVERCVSGAIEASLERAVERAGLKAAAAAAGAGAWQSRHNEAVAARHELHAELRVVAAERVALTEAEQAVGRLRMEVEDQRRAGLLEAELSQRRAEALAAECEATLRQHSEEAAGWVAARAVSRPPAVPITAATRSRPDGHVCAHRAGSPGPTCGGRGSAPGRHRQRGRDGHGVCRPARRDCRAATTARRVGD